MTRAPAILGCILSLLGGGATGAAEVPGPAAKQAETRVATMSLDIDTLSSSPDLSADTLRARFRQIANEYFDIAAMARAALGQEASRLTRDQWQRFLAAYVTHLELGFARGIGKAGASETRVLGSRVGSDGAVVVFARVRTGTSERDLTWIMCRSDPGRICDVESGGIAASTHQRSAFADRLRAEGFDRLVVALEAGWLVEVP